MSEASKQVRHLVSAGGVVYRTGARGMEIVLCGHSASGHWGLPKGTPGPGEKLEETARREVAEETGLEVRIRAKVGSIGYWFRQDGALCHKRVHHFLMEAVGGDTARHDAEFDRVEWFPVEVACKLLTYQNEVDVVRKATALIGGGSESVGEKG